jgi:glycogen(starch) synthase
MRVLMLSWEYPPVVVGGLSRHVHALATHLAAGGHEVVVLCRHPAGTDAGTHPKSDHLAEGVRIIRVAEDPMHLTFEVDLVAWTLAMGHAMVRAAVELLGGWQPDVVHAHDWLVTHPAIAIAEAARVPLVGTVHATEAGRHSGWLSHPLNQQIHSVEWWLANRADAVITCSRAMRKEVAHLFEIEPDDITVIHNGIEERSWQVSADEVAHAREAYSPSGAPLLLFFGRLEWEKGVQDLLSALPRIRRGHPGARLVVAGQGRHLDELVKQARKLRIRRAVDFVGHLTDRELRAALAAADAVVLPSKYEPFGIVALEAAAAMAPLVASTAGGLGEVVIDDALGAAGETVLADKPAARRRACAAQARLAVDFDWSRIAEATADVYRRARVGEPVELGRPKIATGNAFEP